MNMSDKDISILEHIISYCEKISSSIDRFGEGMDIFVNDIDYRASVSMHILQIGELSKRLSDEYISQTVNKMNWYAIRGMRNMFAHDYGSMDLDRIWATAVEDIPALKLFCETELNNLS